MTKLPKHLKDVLQAIETATSSLPTDEWQAVNEQIKATVTELYNKSILARQEGEKAERERIDQWCNEWLRRNGEQVDIGTAIAFSAGLKQALKESHHVK